MATVNNQQLMLQVDASVELLRRNLAQGEAIVGQFERKSVGDLDRFDNRLRRVGLSGLPNLERGMSSARNAAIGLTASLGVVGVQQTATKLLAIADEAKQIDAQLRLATNSFGTFGQAQADARRIADETRSSLAATTSLYGNFVRSSEQTGRSQAEASRATETFAKVLKIGGASAAAAEGATMQFGQALASGALRGDEFNSIAEASPRILRLLADAMGVPQGQLRKLAEEGKLTSDVLYKALTDRRFTDGIDAEFRQLPVTFDEALTKVENAAITTIGAFDRGGQFSTMIATFVSDGADGFGDLESAAEKLGIGARASIEGLANVFDPILDNGLAIFDALGVRVSQFSLDGRREISQLLGALDELEGYGNRLRSSLPGTDANSYKVFGVETMGGPGARERFDTASRASRAAGSARRLERENDEVFDRLLGGRAPRPNELRDYVGGSGRFAPRPRPQAPSTSSGGSRASRVPSSGSSDAERERKRAEEIARRELDRLTKSLNAGVLDAMEDISGSSDPLQGGGAEATESLQERIETITRVRDLEVLAADEAAQAREDGIRQSADLFETLFTQGSGGLWRQFQAEGLRAVSLVLAKLIAGKSFSAAIGGLGGGGGILGALFGGGFATGGIIEGPGTGTSDSILARVSKGEGILTAQAVEHYGPGTVAALNDLALPKFASGGIVGAPTFPRLRSPQLPALNAPGGGSRDRVAVDVKVKTEPSPLLLQTVETTSIRTVSAAAEPIASMAERRTIRTLSRPDLPGGWG